MDFPYSDGDDTFQDDNANVTDLAQFLGVHST